jgi:hypothetical protein
MDKNLSVAMAIARMRKHKAKQVSEDSAPESDIASEIIKRRKAKLTPTEPIDEFSDEMLFETEDDLGEVTAEDPAEAKRRRLESLFNDEDAS